MYHKFENLRKELFVKIDDGVLKFLKSQNLKYWKLLLSVEDLSTKSLKFGYDSQDSEQLMLTPAFGHYNNEEEGT